MPLFPVQRDALSAEFLDGTRRGEFLLVRDVQTGEILAPQFDVSADPQRYERVAAAGNGTVVSWSVIHQKAGNGTVHRLPVGIVELDEGPWWWTSFPKADPDADLFGARVRVAFKTLGEGDAAEAVPYFELI
ncbi:hypothetical protein SAMN04489835_1078 [Mycolicibacterium rutilum]|uniref:ChsH2 C-terminal OB-fold domain-containing protein n=1 Tax=Mycolicibacterium rutilum TaxID=370526 RepID=A0A1H6IV55_MYCRU|nr:OB-fold domain-containing protein [Mycolicibacterium rutilum]SEH53290.1 hypothetical protein SAMN04489835_1078 [Mycolicibacterium rutilum]